MKKPLLLLVDDSPLNLEILGNILEGQYTTAVARDGHKALEFVRKRRPNLILLDIMMPDLDGFEVCAELQAAPETRDIPIIFLTAKTETEDIVKGFQMGAVDYITKPFQKEELIARISTHLALRDAKAQLQEMNATKDRFFSILAHDLRNPFSGLLGLLEVILQNIDAYSKEKLVHLLTMQYEAVKNLFALLENLLTWSRIQRGTLEFEPQAINVNDLVRRGIAVLKPNATQKQITIINQVPEVSMIFADVEMIYTVVRNLLSNAVKFTPPSGTVTIAATETAHTVEIIVTDPGIGIEPIGLAKLFHIDAPYRRLGTAEEKGTGLGLILCKEFVERHGGTIGVESQLGHGSTFRFTLPRQAP